MTSETGIRRNRIHVFVDLSNLELTMREMTGYPFRFDWGVLPRWLVGEAARVAGLASWEYAGTHVYASYDPQEPGSEQFRRWLRDWLGHAARRAGRCEGAPAPPSASLRNCRNEIRDCPSCERPVHGTEEKGVDTAIVTDMIRLAWEDAYDIAVLVSSDSDFIPAIQFLDQRGRKVIQAGFPRTGQHLKGPCWANFDLFERRGEFERQ